MSLPKSMVLFLFLFFLSDSSILGFQIAPANALSNLPQMLSSLYELNVLGGNSPLILYFLLCSGISWVPLLKAACFHLKSGAEMGVSIPIHNAKKKSCVVSGLMQ